MLPKPPSADTTPQTPTIGPGPLRGAGPMTGVPAGEALRRADAAERQARYLLHAEICKVLTDPKRLRLLDALRRAARTVGELAAEVRLSVPNTSQHLAVLRHAELVETRRVGTTIQYRLSEPELMEACDVVDRIVRRRLGQPGEAA